MVAEMNPNCADVDAEDAESKFRKTLRQIITLAPKIKCPHEQQIMHEWIDRLMQPPCSDEDVERRMEYSRYMVYQLKRGKLHTPFLESPCQGELKPLDEMLVTGEPGQPVASDEPCCPELCCPDQGKGKKGGISESQKPEQGTPPPEGKRLSLSQQRRRTSLALSVSKGVGGGAVDEGCQNERLEENRRRVTAVMNCLNFDEVTLEAFVTQLAPHTFDKGKTLMELVTQEQIDYKHQIECIYRAKEEKISQELAREQAEIPHRYEVAKQKMLSRAMAGLNYIKSVVPSFQYEKWQANPDYLRDMFKTVQKDSGKKSVAQDSMAEWERKNLQMLHDVNYEAERLEEANADKEKQIQELLAQQTALEQDFSCKKAQLAKKVQDLESEKLRYCIANDERDRMIEHLLRTLQTLNAQKAELDNEPC
ncbi:hypothetical protein LSTR_LSTR015738 [Laodelphax striatellus]|uniref:DUF4485 domain-containing protein n=1 Tax=Laodelphax striatellus TaxID=195883 RepID=A0A482WM78_LAOST|nr:hypothetical protein LSTR_LSTR015738 [Laodelphax striatellus]